MDIIIKLFGLGIVIVISNMVLEQSGRKEISFAINLVGIVLALALVIPEINDLFRSVTTMFNFR